MSKRIMLPIYQEILQKFDTSEQHACLLISKIIDNFNKNHLKLKIISHSLMLLL